MVKDISTIGNGGTGGQGSNHKNHPAAQVAKLRGDAVQPKTLTGTAKQNNAVTSRKK